jgi:hypothetical protein
VHIVIYLKSSILVGIGMSCALCMYISAMALVCGLHVCLGLKPILANFVFLAVSACLVCGQCQL